MDPSQLPLRDLHLPEPTGWWPPAPGWWLLAALALAALAWLLHRWRERRRHSAARRFALQQLAAAVDAYGRHGSAVQLGAELSEILRRTMLAYAPRDEVAGLTGEAWLAWLDRDLDKPHFTAGDGRPLIEWPYRKPDTPVDRSDVAAFVDAIRLRLRTPVGGHA
ncbi:MAG: DUF4381 domain-containing protein [Woeseiaceae bacterium]|nr:DUF4381 domain-containing protein [Woeseiaceae bacterium]